MDAQRDLDIEADFLKNPEHGFRAVFDRYSGPLLRFLYRFTANTEAAEEILQDLFFELLKGSYRPQEGANLKAWLFTVARNRALNHRKRAKKSVNLESEQLTEPSNLENETINVRLLSHLQQAERKLPAEIQETWELRKRGYDNQQIAEALSIPLGTVKSRFSRLVDYLRKEF